MEYKPTIGLEVHAELKTKTKMFCACKNDSDEKRPNVNICPICLAHPGTLPVINKQAVKHVLKVGLTVGGRLADFSEFDRKNYFYPDIPKGYQISQYKYPLVSGGMLAGVALTRIHLEEDTGKSIHDSRGASLVDFNRAGVPLMELVTEPMLHSGGEVARFGKELQILLQTLEVSHANMEKGEMRLEANISVQRGDPGSSFEGLPLGTKVEVKNLNSFRSAERAVAYEIKRQIALLESNQKVTQETRGWDEVREETFSQRTKEDSHDYRYFPDPDLPKLKLTELADFSEQSLRSETKETPEGKRERFKKEYGIKDSDISFYILNPELGVLFEKAASFVIHINKNFQLLSNYIVSDISGLKEKGLAVNPKNLAKLVAMFLEGAVSSRGVKDILSKMIESGEDPELIGKRDGLYQQSDTTELLKVVEELISKNGVAVAEYKSGKVSALQFLVGQGMKATGGSANPQLLRDLIEESLK